MSKRWLDYNPLTGATEWYEEADGKVFIHIEQRVDKFLDAIARIRNDEAADKAWTKNGVATYAHLPEVVVGQMLKKGIKLWDPEHIGAVLKEVNTNYPYLKTTRKHHEV